jgi:hypothetical protein
MTTTGPGSEPIGDTGTEREPVGLLQMHDVSRHCMMEHRRVRVASGGDAFEGEEQ